jgi:thiol-disulfide isomerase/thioredoxin
VSALRRPVCRAVAALALAVLSAGCGGSGATGAAARAPARSDLEPVNRPGELVELEQLLVPGQVTVVDFWADWCRPCHEVEGRLVAALAGRSGVVIRKIDVRDRDSAVARRYDIGVLPHLRIYGRDGVLVYALIGENAYRAGELTVEVLGSRQSTVDGRQ